MISSTILFFSVAWTLGERKWLRLLLISAAVSVAIYYGFTAGLQLKLPLGFEFLFPTEVEEW
jgi:putative tricarboxylic transport membrane protein